MIYYMDGGPFETTTPTGASALVLGYDPEARKFAAVLVENGACTECRFWHGSMFTPPPPIPAAARKPQAGEVWLMQGSTMRKAVVRLILATGSVGYKALTPDAYPVWYDADWALRPATPAESEPFRPIFEGLERSLGES